MLVNESLRCCWEMLEADTDGWKDADGALSVLFWFLLDHCQCPLCKRKNKKGRRKIPVAPPPTQISESQVFFMGTLEIEFATLHSNLK